MFHTITPILQNQLLLYILYRPNTIKEVYMIIDHANSQLVINSDDKVFSSVFLGTLKNNMPLAIIGDRDWAKHRNQEINVNDVERELRVPPVALENIFEKSKSNVLHLEIYNILDSEDNIGEHLTTILFLFNADQIATIKVKLRNLFLLWGITDKHSANDFIEKYSKLAALDEIPDDFKLSVLKHVEIPSDSVNESALGGDLYSSLFTDMYGFLDFEFSFTSEGDEFSAVLSLGAKVDGEMEYHVWRKLPFIPLVEAVM